MTEQSLQATFFVRQAGQAQTPAETDALSTPAAASTRLQLLAELLAACFVPADPNLGYPGRPGADPSTDLVEALTDALSALGSSACSCWQSCAQWPG